MHWMMMILHMEEKEDEIQEDIRRKIRRKIRQKIRRKIRRKIRQERDKKIKPEKQYIKKIEHKFD